MSYKVKRNYATDVKNAQYWVPVPANNPQLNIRRNRLSLESDDIREILKPVIDEVVKLVLDQIRATN